MVQPPTAVGVSYPIGSPGQPWGDSERAEWLQQCEVQRSYLEHVVQRLEPLKQRFDVSQYGALSYDATRYPLFAVKTRDWSAAKPNILVTGGVHGYETSGVLGAMTFLETEAANYTDAFNICVLPCISPWGFEHIQRWAPTTVDPNRAFGPNATVSCEEA